MTLKRFMPVLAMLVLLTAPIARAASDEMPAKSHTAAPIEKEAGKGEASPELLPDLHDAQTWYGALWVVIIFVVLLAILYPTAWKQVLAGLKAREERIRRDIADAEAAREKAQAVLKGYNDQLAQAGDKVREMIAAATADGQQIAMRIRMEAQQDAEQIKERAMREIDTARKQAVQDIYAQAAELSTSIAEKILRRSLNVDDQRDLVRSSIELMNRG